MAREKVSNEEFNEAVQEALSRDMIRLIRGLPDRQDIKDELKAWSIKNSEAMSGLVKVLKDSISSIPKDESGLEIMGRITDMADRILKSNSELSEKLEKLINKEPVPYKVSSVTRNHAGLFESAIFTPIK
jgi:hypothetical protein